jgi:hypothetical protein
VVHHERTQHFLHLASIDVIVF